MDGGNGRAHDGCEGEYCGKGIRLAAHDRKLDHHDSWLAQHDEAVGRILAASERAIDDNRATREETARTRKLVEKMVDHTLSVYQSGKPPSIEVETEDNTGILAVTSPALARKVARARVQRNVSVVTTAVIAAIYALLKWKGLLP